MNPVQPDSDSTLGPRAAVVKYLDALDSEQMVNVLGWIVGAAGFFILSAYAAYFLRFHGGFSEKRDAWGQFGDFIGGTVNPLLSFMTLLALIFTVVLQTRQLEHSRAALANSKEELLATREEMARSTAAQTALAEAASTQAGFASLTARISALQASLSVVSEVITQARAGVVGFTPSEFNAYVLDKERLAGEILRINSELLASSRAEPTPRS